jgi:hypothetical protein
VLGRFSTLLVIVLAVVAPKPALGQVTVDTSEISGVVVDPSGSRIADASVTALDVARGRRWTVQTDDSGEYRLTLLPPAQYRLTVEKAGFEPLVQESVDALVGSTARVDLALTIAGVNLAVDVSAPSAALDPTRVQLAGVVVARQLEELPINGRNFLDFALLTPGVTNSTTLVDQADFRTPTAPASGLSFAGGNGRGNTITLDGVPNNGNTGNFRPAVPQEAVQEFQVNRTGYSAETGGSVGGAVSVVTRSGTNTTQGTGFVLFRDRALQSRNYFDPEKSAFRRWQVGGSAGGPIRRDRTFYFAAFEQLDRDESAFVSILNDPTVLDRVTPAQSDLVRALSATPALSALGAGLQSVLTPSSNPAVPALFAANSGVFPFSGVTTQGMIRVDDRLTTSQMIQARVNATRERLANNRLGALAGYNHGSSSERVDGTVAFGDNIVLSDRWLAAIRGAFAPDRFSIHPTDAMGPELVVSGYGTFGRDYLYPLRQREQYFDAQVTVTHARGSHLLKAGVDINPVLTQVDLESFFGGRFIFGEYVPLGVLLDAATGSPGFAAALRDNLAAAGSVSAASAIDAPLTALQAFALGIPVAYIQAFGNTYAEATRHQHSAFVEDVFRARDTITITAGARLHFNAMTNLQSRTYVEPRAGASWTIASGTIVRGAAGIYHAWVDGTIGYSAAQLKRTDVTNVFIPLSGAAPVTNPATGLPVTSADVYQSLLARGILGRRAITLADLAPLGIRPGIPFPVTGGVDENYDAPRAVQGDVELERTFGLVTTRASYGFNQTTHLWRTRDRNLTQIGTRPDGWPIFGLVNPMLLNNYVIESTGQATAHMLTLEAARRFAGRWTLDAHYTFSHARDDVTDFNIDYAPHNQVDPKADEGPSLFSTPHVFVASGTFAQDARGTSPSWRSGWSASAIMRANSGRPFNVLTGFDNLGDGQANTHRPLGLGRNAGQGPGFSSLDARVAWTGPVLSRRTRLQLTLEAFNLFDRVNFSTVNNIVGSTPLSSLPDPIVGHTGSAVAPLAFTAAYPARQFQLGVRLLY